MNVPCPKCTRELDIDERYAGSEVTCSECDYVFMVPPIPGREPSPFATPMDPALLYAGFWKRFLAFFLDSFIVGFVVGFVGFFILFILALSGSDPEQLQIIAVVALYLTPILLRWPYTTLFESSAKQATPGKMALGIIVTDLDGNRISFARANGRFFGKFFSYLFMYFGFFMAGFTEKKQALHDMMAGCLVVNR